MYMTDKEVFWLVAGTQYVVTLIVSCANSSPTTIFVRMSMCLEYCRGIFVQCIAKIGAGAPSFDGIGDIGRTPFGEPLGIRESMRVNTSGSVLIRSEVSQR
jgi:hypothetical protein